MSNWMSRLANSRLQDAGIDVDKLFHPETVETEQQRSAKLDGAIKSRGMSELDNSSQFVAKRLHTQLEAAGYQAVPLDDNRTAYTHDQLGTLVRKVGSYSHQVHWFRVND